MVIEEVRWWGLASGETLLRCDLGHGDGPRILARLIQGGPATSAPATPLGALVDYVKDSRSVSEVKAKCAALVSSEPRPAV